MFGNKEFERFDGTGFRTSQSEAMLRAERLRDLGNNARVVKYAKGYGVYVRKPKTPMERKMATRRIMQGRRNKAKYGGVYGKQLEFQTQQIERQLKNMPVSQRKLKRG